MRAAVSTHRQLTGLRPAPAVVLIAAGLAALLIVLAGSYGPHRDELYFVAAGHHLAVGYPDQGPLTPLIARAMDDLGGGSLTVLRLPSALMGGAVVMLTGLLARELGGTARAEAIAAACSAVAAVLLQNAHTLSTSTFDLLAWTLITWLVVRAMNTGRDGLWPVAGVVLGLGLLNKPLPAFLAAGLLGGVVIAGPRELLRNRWVWAGAAIAAVMWAPWLVWQAKHGWPQIDVSRSIANGGSASSQPPWAFLPFQLLLVSPLLAPVWIAGLVRLFRDYRLSDLRFLGWAWVLMAAVFIATGGKPYYLAGMFPLLLGAGAKPVDRWLGRARGRRVAFGAAVALSAAVCAVIALPVLPREDLDPVIAMNPDAGETVGWPGLARTVAGVPGAVVLAHNYGEAGAIDRYGRRRAYSGHNGYGEWGPPPGRRAPVVAVGYGAAELRRSFTGCSLRARVHSPGGIDNDEDGSPVWRCTGLRRPWRELWPGLKRLG